MTDRYNGKPAPEEPKVHTAAWLAIILCLGVYNFIRGILDLFFPRDINDMQYWWTYLLSALFFFAVALLLYFWRKSELRRHKDWEDEYAQWQWEMHKREVERMELEIQQTKAETERIKAKIAAGDLDPGEDDEDDDL